VKTIHTELGVGAPAAITWGVVTDLEGWARWNPIMRGEGRFEFGARPQITIASPGAKPILIRPEIVKLDEGREVRWLRRMAVPGLLDGEHGIRVVAEDTGRCRLEHFEVFRGLLANFFIGRNAKAIETGFQAMNRSLKREAERVARERA